MGPTRSGHWDLGPLVRKAHSLGLSRLASTFGDSCTLLAPHLRHLCQDSRKRTSDGRGSWRGGMESQGWGGQCPQQPFLPADPQLSSLSGGQSL